MAVAPGASQILSPRLCPAICIAGSNLRFDGRILAGICISPRYTANYSEGGRGKLMAGTPINWQLSCPRQWRKLSRAADDSGTHSKDWVTRCVSSIEINSIGGKLIGNGACRQLRVPCTEIALAENWRIALGRAAISGLLEGSGSAKISYRDGVLL